MEYISTKRINKSITRSQVEFIGHSENIYLQQINEVADEIILGRHEKPIILLSGPSGSGKTTTALRTEKVLKENGLEAVTISLDNYFFPHGTGEMPLDENGKIDLESPLRMDIELLNEHIAKIIKGEPIEIPVFEFKTQSRKKTIPFRRDKNQIIIFEGIHALNPLINGNGLSDSTLCVYVSVRTRIKISKHEHADDTKKYVHPEKIRLMRRIIRDKLFRARDISETLDMLASVSRGEHLYILPHKHRANFDIDTFLAYEASAYAPIILNDLNVLKDNCVYAETAGELLALLSELEPIDNTLISEFSLIREFIGGSELRY